MDGLTPAQIDEIREFIGHSEPPTDIELGRLYERLGDTTKVALAVLRSRLADLLTTPGKWDLDGDYSEDNTATLRELRSAIRDLEAVAGSDTSLPVVTTVDLVRDGVAR